MEIYKTANGFLAKNPYRIFCLAESRNPNIHSHDFFELAYIYEGCGKSLGDCPTAVNEGDFLLILPGGNHCTVSNEKGAPWVRVCNLLATMDYFFNICKKCVVLTGDTEFFDMLTSGEPTCLIMRDSKDGAMLNILRTMLDEHDTNDEYTPAMMQNLFVNLLITASRLYNKKRSSQNEETVTKKNIHLIKSYIKSHIGEKLTLDLLAAQLHYSPEYFSRYFKQATGKNVSEYITNLRIDRAKELLESTDMPISDICYECGYSSLSNFRSNFGKYCGMSPKEFRKQR